jgi:hypothetical protein
MASLRAPTHHYYPSQTGPNLLSNLPFPAGHHKELTNPSVQTLGAFSSAMAAPVLSNQALPTTSQMSSKSYSAMANVYSVPKDDRSPNRCGEPWQQPMPQVLQGSPNSPFYEHLRRSRMSGSGARRDGSENERSGSLVRGQPREPMAGRALASHHYTNPSSLTNMYRSDTPSDAVRMDATLPRMQNVQHMSNWASPNQESLTPGSLGKQVGGYPMQF